MTPINRRTLIAGAVAVAGASAVEKVWAQPALPTVPAPPIGAKAARDGFVGVIVEGVYQGPLEVDGKAAGTTPVLVFKARDAERFGTIWIGQVEAASILRALQNTPPQRPNSHDLMAALVKGLKGEVEAVYLQTGPQEGVFYSKIKVAGGGVETEIDSRPSDAVALALRVQAPILVAADLLKETTLEALKRELGVRDE
jgi:bifunctional DNase/RNase